MQQKHGSLKLFNRTEIQCNPKPAPVSEWYQRSWWHISSRLLQNSKSWPPWQCVTSQVAWSYFIWPFYLPYHIYFRFLNKPKISNFETSFYHFNLTQTYSEFYITNISRIMHVNNKNEKNFTIEPSFFWYIPNIFNFGSEIWLLQITNIRKISRNGHVKYLEVFCRKTQYRIWKRG